MDVGLNRHHSRVYWFIRDNPGAPRSTTIAEECGYEIKDTRLLLAELSRRGYVQRSRRGLYRPAADFPSIDPAR